MLIIIKQTAKTTLCAFSGERRWRDANKYKYIMLHNAARRMSSYIIFILVGEGRSILLLEKNYRILNSKYVEATIGRL